MKDHHIKDYPSKVLQEFATATGKQEQDKYQMQTSIPMGSDLETAVLLFLHMKQIQW